MIANSRTPFLRGTSFLVGALLLAGCDVSRGTGDADLRQAVRDAGSGGSAEMASSVRGSAIRFDIHREALGHAIAMSPAVRGARMRLDEGSALMAELRSGSRTQVTASATAGGVAELEGSGDRRAGGGLEMNASRLLYDGGRLAARLDAAGARRIGQEAEVLATASETGRDAALAWIAVWQARSRLALLGESLTRARPLLAQVEEVIAAGALDRTAGLSLRRRILDIETREAELRSDLRVALREFERLFGTLPPEDLAAPGALSTPADLERIVARLDSAPRIVLAAAEIVASDRDLSAARAEARPMVRAGARLSNPLTARSAPEIGIGLTLEHDFGGRGRTQARIAAAESRLEESRSRFEELRGSLGVALGGAFERLTSLRGTAASLDGQISLVEEELEGLRAQLGSGQATPGRLLEVELDRHEIRDRRIRTRAGLLEIEADILGRSGMLADLVGFDPGRGETGVGDSWTDGDPAVRISGGSTPFRRQAALDFSVAPY